MFDNQYSLVSSSGEVIGNEYSLVRPPDEVIGKGHSLVRSSGEVIGNEYSLVRSSGEVIGNEYSLVRSSDEDESSMDEDESSMDEDKSPSVDTILFDALSLENTLDIVKGHLKSMANEKAIDDELIMAVFFLHFAFFAHCSKEHLNDFFPNNPVFKSLKKDLSNAQKTLTPKLDKNRSKRKLFLKKTITADDLPTIMNAAAKKLLPNQEDSREKILKNLPLDTRGVIAALNARYKKEKKIRAIEEEGVIAVGYLGICAVLLGAALVLPTAGGDSGVCAILLYGLAGLTLYYALPHMKEILSNLREIKEHDAGCRSSEYNQALAKSESMSKLTTFVDDHAKNSNTFFAQSMTKMAHTVKIAGEKTFTPPAYMPTQSS